MLSELNTVSLESQKSTLKTLPQVTREDAKNKPASTLELTSDNELEFQSMLRKMGLKEQSRRSTEILMFKETKEVSPHDRSLSSYLGPKFDFREKLKEQLLERMTSAKSVEPLSTLNVVEARSQLQKIFDHYALEQDRMNSEFIKSGKLHKILKDAAVFSGSPAYLAEVRKRVDLIFCTVT